MSARLAAVLGVHDHGEQTRALARWGLEDAETSAVAGGATNWTWLVRANADRWFLRRYRTADAVAVRRQHRLIEAAAVGVNTPVPARCDDGSSIVEIDESLFALFPAVVGEQHEPDSLGVAHARSAGAFLARLHGALAGLDGRGLHRWDLRWDGPAWVERVEATAALVPADDAADADEIDRWARERLAQQAAWLSDARCVHEYVPTFPAQVIHGDFHHANLFFRGPDVVGVIDWDVAAVMPRAFEVARACSFMFQVDPTRSQSFVAGYRSVTDLDDAELADGARAWGCYADHHVWPVEEYYRNGNRAAGRFIPRRRFEPFLDAWSRVQSAVQ